MLALPVAPVLEAGPGVTRAWRDLVRPGTAECSSSVLVKNALFARPVYRQAAAAARHSQEAGQHRTWHQGRETRGLPGTQVAAGGNCRQRDLAGGVWGRGASERGRCPWRFQAGAFGAGVQGSSVLRRLCRGAPYAWPASSISAETSTIYICRSESWIESMHTCRPSRLQRGCRSQRFSFFRTGLV